MFIIYSKISKLYRYYASFSFFFTIFSTILLLRKFSYYSKASKKVADKITNSIVDKTIMLEITPRMGQKEELLAHFKQEIRYLVQGNYKIVYLIKENIVSIATVFDCRQDPIKLKIRSK